MTTDSRDRIVAEAEQLFADHGFAGTSLSRIAKAADLGNPGVLHHFPSKAAIYRAVLESIGQDLEGRDAAALAASDDPVDRLYRLVDALLALHDDRPTALRIIAQEFLDRSGRIEEATRLPLARVVNDAVEVIAAGQEAGRVASGDPLVLTAAIHGALLHGLLGRSVYQRTADHPVDADTWRGEIATAALRGVLVPGDREMTVR